jgi:hypothetical protein
MHVGGTAIMRSSDMAQASGRVVHGSAHLSGGGTLSASGSVLPDQVGVDRTAWDIGCSGFGAMIGGAALGNKGMVVGGVTGYVWGRFRWHRK